MRDFIFERGNYYAYYYASLVKNSGTARLQRYSGVRYSSILHWCSVRYYQQSAEELERATAGET